MTTKGVKRPAERDIAPSKKVKVSEKEEESADELDDNSSLDSLDELDSEEEEGDEEGEDGSKEEEEEGEEAEEGDSSNRTEKTQKESREEHRKLLQERKMKRKSGIEVERIKRLWEKLRVRNPPVPKEIRKKLSDEAWSLCHGVIGDLVLKHDASRVVQTLVKFSSKDRRDQICKELEPYYYQLATSAYGKYLLVKLLHYGSKESRALIIKSLHGKYRKLLRHKEGAYVLEDMFVLYATATQQQQMLREFWGARFALFHEGKEGKTVEEACAESPENRRIIAANLSTTIKASVEKGSTGFQVLHAVMKEYIKIFEGEEVRDFIDLVKDQVAEMVHTPEGAEVACTIVAKSNAKERKAILKGLKPHAMLMVKNEFGHNVLQTIFMTVDDTKLVDKTFSVEYSDKFTEVLVDKYARRPFLYLLNGLDKAYFSPKAIDELDRYMEMSKETSKKPQDKRRTELLQYFIPLFYKTLEDHPYELLRENMGSQFVQELIMNNELPSASQYREKALTIILDSVKGDLTKEDHLIHEKYTERLLKSLLQGGKWNREKKTVEKIENIGIGYDFAKKFAEELFDSGDDEDAIKMWISESESCFVLVGLVDCFKLHEEEPEARKFLETIKKEDKFIADQDSKGAQLLGKIIIQ